MPRLLLAFLLFVFASVSYAAPEIVELQKEKVVKIKVSRYSDTHRFKGQLLPQHSIAFGFMIGNNEILTAAHTIWGAKSIEVIAIDGRKFPAEIANLDADLDKAVIRVNGNMPFSVLFRATPLKSGEEVYAMDSQWMLKQGAIRGVGYEIKYFQKNSSSVSLILIDIEGREGMSGGPLFDVNGRVAGIIMRILTDGTNRLIALPINEALQRLR